MCQGQAACTCLRADIYHSPQVLINTRINIILRGWQLLQALDVFHGRRRGVLRVTAYLATTTKHGIGMLDAGWSEVAIASPAPECHARLVTE